MAGFAMRSFCGGCGAFRQTMPFGKGKEDAFFDSDPCRRCGFEGENRYVVAKKGLRGPWVDAEGNEVA